MLYCFAAVVLLITSQICYVWIFEYLGEQAYRKGSSEFGEVRIHRTSSNHCDKRGSRPTGKVLASLGQFDHTEPSQTPVMNGEACGKGSFE